MTEPAYNPELHHRRSIRMKGHDYAGGGVYFVTLCAHREFIAWAGGSPFGGLDEAQHSGAPCEASCSGAPCEAPVRRIIEEEWLRGGALRDDVFPGEFVVMPDHFHGLIRLSAGASELGHVIGAFKAAVTRRLRRGDTHGAFILVDPNGAQPPTDMRVWHRNYYEVIVRSLEAETRITEYIRLNPWKCVQQVADGLRGMGNPSLWNRKKLGVLCSRNAPKIGHIPEAEVYLGGWHSPKEREIFEWLLRTGKRVIACPAWGISGALGSPRVGAASPCSPPCSGAPYSGPPCEAPVRAALAENRLLVLEMVDQRGDLAAAEARNRFVVEQADDLFVPHKTPGGMLDRILREYWK